MFLDIHSHILPAVDDGAQSLSESIEILKMMKSQGITHVIATPHFYPFEDTLDDFSKKVTSAYNAIKIEAQKNTLPEIFLGAEVLYYEGISDSMSLYDLCLSNSNFLLLEFSGTNIPNRAFEDLRVLIENHGIIPIIAHIERYAKNKNFKKLLRFIKGRNIPAQINADSLLENSLASTFKMLFKKGIVTYIATDSHSTDFRTPKLNEAKTILDKKYDETIYKKLKANSIKFLDRITFEEFHI